MIRTTVNPTQADLALFPQVDAVFRAIQETGSRVIQAHLAYDDYRFAGGHTEPVSRLNLVLSLARVPLPRPIKATPYHKQRRQYDYRSPETCARPTRLYTGDWGDYD